MARIFEIATLVVAIIMTLSWMYGIRSYVSKGQGLMMGTVNSTVLFIISIVVLLATQKSYLHLLWAFPASILLGTLSQTVFPLTLLSHLGNLVARVCIVGIDREAARQNFERRELVEGWVREGLTKEEIEQKIREFTDQ